MKLKKIFALIASIACIGFSQAVTIDEIITALNGDNPSALSTLVTNYLNDGNSVDNLVQALVVRDVMSTASPVMKQTVFSAFRSVSATTSNTGLKSSLNNALKRVPAAQNFYGVNKSTLEIILGVDEVTSGA